MKDTTWQDFLARKAKNMMLGEIRYVDKHDGDFALIHHPFLYWDSTNGFVDRSLENWGHKLLTKACKVIYPSPQEFKSAVLSLDLETTSIKKLRHIEFFSVLFAKAIYLLREDPLFNDKFQLRMLLLAICETEHFRALFETKAVIPTTLWQSQECTVALLKEKVFESCMENWLKDIKGKK